MKLSNITNKELVAAKVKEGSFWGRDDMVAKMKKDEKESGMKKFVKIDDKGNHHGVTTSDPDKWKELIADGWKEDEDYYKGIKEEDVTVDNAGNIAGYLATIDEYAEMLFKSAKDKKETEIAYRIQNAVDDIRTRELGLKPSNIRASFANESLSEGKQEHSLALLKAVAAQMDKDARNGDYTSIDELLEDIPTERLEGYLSDNLYPYVEEAESKKNCGCGKDPCETYGKKTEAVVEGTMIGGLMKYDGQPEGEYADAVARYKEFMSQPRPPSEEVTNMVQGFVFDDELLDSLGEAEDGGDVLDVRYIVQSRLEDFFGPDFKLEEGKYKSHAQRKAVHASKAEKLNEIDPSRSPWTQSGKHPGAMSRKELKREIAVFDELMARGDTLSPRELMQLDSLYGYLEGDNLAEEMVKEANRTIQKIQWKESRNK
jgi:hypothetical protein